MANSAKYAKKDAETVSGGWRILLENIYIRDENTMPHFGFFFVTMEYLRRMRAISRSNLISVRYLQIQVK